jgi:trimeric autotransporter adhesin
MRSLERGCSNFMFTRHRIVLLLSLVIPLFGQTNTTLNLSTQGRNADFSNFPFTRPLTQGSSLPSTCQVGQLFFQTSAPIGANMFSCVSPNTWAGVGSGYTYTLPQATAITLGGVMAGAGLAVSSGTLSANVGTAAGTVAAGNDSRITGAVQASNNLSDVANVTTALQNLKLTGASPLSISAPTTGNAATATRLAAPPTGCAFGQYATSVAASGNANCAQVQYSQVSGAPSAYSLPAATTTALGGVIAGSGLAVSSGTLSANIGTAAGSVAAGNDSRITGAVQSSNNLADLANITTALANLKLTGATPVSISAPTTGNAATATRLAATPTACVAGQYATSIATSGNANCGQIQYSQVSGTPAAYSLPAATSTTLGGVIAGSGLAVSSGTLSASVGTASGTVAAGNDSRITGAVQASNNLSDIANKTTALQNLKLTGTNPATITSDTTGNAASASTLQGTGPLRIVGGINPAMLVQSCGASPTIAGSDSAGIVLVGTGTVTSCTIPFATAFANPPICTANDNTDFLVLKASTSTTALTLSAQSSFASDALSYICIGK